MQTTFAEKPTKLSKIVYERESARQGVVILEINWGRHWNCGDYENIQLQRMTFAPISNGVAIADRASLELTSPSTLSARDEFSPYALVVEPGTWALIGFDVKTARSVSDVGHFVGEIEHLIVDGQPQGGTFTIAAGEIIYIGHFSRDCDEGPIPWRYYLSTREEFERYVERFREWYPFTSATPVEYRLFSTERLGRPFELEDPVVPGIE